MAQVDGMSDGSQNDDSRTLEQFPPITPVRHHVAADVSGDSLPTHAPTASQSAKLDKALPEMV